MIYIKKIIIKIKSLTILLTNNILNDYKKVLKKNTI